MENQAKSLIAQFYSEEEKLKEQEQALAKLEVRVKPSDIAMLTTIAKRFNKSEEQIGREALAGAIYNMFEALQAKERKALAKEADEAETKMLADAAKKLA